MKISQIKKQSRQYLKGNFKRSNALLLYIFINIIILTSVPYLLSRFSYGKGIALAACAAVLVLNLFSYSVFFSGRSAWFLFFNKKKRAARTLYWFSPSRLFKSSGTYLKLIIKKAAMTAAFLLPGIAVILSAVITALNGGVEFDLFVPWAAGGALIFAAGLVFLMIALQRYFLVPYLRVENPKLRSKDIFRQSRAEMDGNLKKAFLLKLSFLPLFITCAAVFPVFYVWAYYNQSCALMAKDIQNDNKLPATLGK